MAYAAYAAVKNLVGPAALLAMLDDDLDGVEDAGLFDALAQDASDQVDAYLSAQYDVPFTGSVPLFVSLCAKVFICETLYQRRGVAKEANPWTKQADSLRMRLEKIAAGKDLLDAAQTAVGSDSVEIVTEPSRLAQRGPMMF